MHYIAVLFVALSATVHTGYSLKCYICATNTINEDPKACRDPFNATFHQDYLVEPNIMSKDLVCTKEVYGEGESQNIRRGFSTSKQTKTYCKSVRNHTQYCGYCSMDGCNSGLSNIVQIIHITLPCIVALITAG